MTKIIALFESKAFDTALLTAIAAAGAVFGFNVPVGTIMLILTPLMVAAGVAGWSDAVKMKMKMQLEHETKMHALQHGNTTLDGSPRDAEGRALPRQAGFAKLSIMIVVAMLTGGLIVGGTLATEGCGASPPPIVTDVVDCVKAEGVVVTDGYSITQVINAVYGAIASIATDGLPAALAVLTSIAATWGPDLVACIVDDYPTAGGGSGSGSGSAASPPPAQLALFKLNPAVKAQLLQQLAPGKKLNHGKVK